MVAGWLRGPVDCGCVACSESVRAPPRSFWICGRPSCRNGTWRILPQTRTVWERAKLDWWTTWLIDRWEGRKRPSITPGHWMSSGSARTERVSCNGTNPKCVGCAARALCCSPGEWAPLLTDTSFYLLVHCLTYNLCTRIIYFWSKSRKKIAQRTLAEFTLNFKAISRRSVLF